MIPSRPVQRSGSTRVRVRYSECDSMGVVYHGAYVPWLEIARTEMLRLSGISYRELEGQGVLLVVVRLEARYRRPVKYDDVVEVRARVSRTSAVKIEHEYDVVVVERNGAPSEEIAATAATTLACVDRDGKVRALPAWLAGTDAGARAERGPNGAVR